MRAGRAKPAKAKRSASTLTPMTNAQAKELFATLFHEWAQGLSPAQRERPRFAAFKSWLIEKNYMRYMQFEPADDPEADVHRWFNTRYRLSV